MTLQQSPAEVNELALRQCVEKLTQNFLFAGHLLLENYSNAYWSMNRHESFRDFVESLGIGSYSTANRLMHIADLQRRNVLTQGEIYEIGVSKCFLLLPRARDGEISDGLREIAKHGTVNDLRLELGQTVPEKADVMILCPRCGAEIHGAKWTGKEK